MTKLQIVLSLFALTAALSAQTHTVRGGVEDVQNTQNQFFLDCTNIPVFSNTIDLNLWTDTDAIMQVVNVGTAGNPTLRVESIAPSAKVFDMGNLRFGQSNTWEVNAPAGSFAMMFIDFTANTGFNPVPGLDVYLLGPSAFTLASGMTTAQGQFQTSFTVPNMPQFAGISVSSQALVLESTNWYFSNPDCKIIGQ